MQVRSKEQIKFCKASIDEIFNHSNRIVPEAGMTYEVHDTLEEDQSSATLEIKGTVILIKSNIQSPDPNIKLSEFAFMTLAYRQAFKWLIEWQYLSGLVVRLVEKSEKICIIEAVTVSENCGTRFRMEFNAI